MDNPKLPPLFHLSVLICGIVAASTAVIFIKLCSVNPIALASYRLLAATVFLLPLFIRDWRRHSETYTRQDFFSSILPGIILALHFITWIYGARMTPAANASLIVCLVPLATPFLLAMLVSERLTRNELLATTIALLGVSWLALSDFNTNPEYFKGDVTCFISMLLFALYLVLARKNRHVSSVWLYVVPLYCIAGIFCLACSFFVTNPFAALSGRNLLCILGLALIPTIVGHSSFNYAMKHFRGQVVSVLTMCEFVTASIMAYFILSEVPSPSFYITAVLVLLSGAIILGGVYSASRKKTV
jgi:drug/metabolite transporter (DMT)-like permease